MTPSRVVFTDLDGTLLDHDTYSWDAALPAVDRLRDSGIPLVIVTSKTRAEVEDLRFRLGNRHPFIVENGGALFIPEDSFAFPLDNAPLRDGYHVIEWGAPHPALIAALQSASTASACPVRAFHQLTPEEIAAETGLALAVARLAKRREYDEPFTPLSHEKAPALAAAIEASGFRVTRGGRYWHILGASDKGKAVRHLLDMYRRAAAGPIASLALGDGLNDLEMLASVDTPIIVRSPKDQSRLIAALPNATVTALTGPQGWHDAVLRWLQS